MGRYNIIPEIVNSIPNEENSFPEHPLHKEIKKDRLGKNRDKEEQISRCVIKLFHFSLTKIPIM